MKKISYLELSTIFLTLITYFNSNINMYIIKESNITNGWIIIFLSYIIGIIPLSITLKIVNYKKNLNLFEKNKNLFGDIIGNIINITISIILIIIAIVILNNITNFITTQFLYHTPKIITMSLLIILATYCSSQEINVIMHTSIILTGLNIIIFIISKLSLIPNIKLDNLLPLILPNTNNIILTALKIVAINILPIILILIIPKDKITNQSKYNKAIIITYIIGFIASVLTQICTISTLGIYLTNIYEYPEYNVLKTIKLFGFLERSENIISISWIVEAYLYMTIIIYTISKNIPKKSNKTFTYTNTITGLIILLLTKYFCENISHFNHYIKTTFTLFISTLTIIYIIILTKIVLTEKRKIAK